jgi:hypothetical protein
MAKTGRVALAVLYLKVNMKIQFILHKHMMENPSPLQQARIFAFLGKN